MTVRQKYDTKNERGIRVIVKRFRIGDRMISFCCYEACPDDAPIDIRTVVNTRLGHANEFMDKTYAAYHQAYPNVTRPKIYVYIRPDAIDDVNAFTDGRDIYLSAGVMIDMQSYISERLNTSRYDGREILPEELKVSAHNQIWKYLMELIVGHELAHIWNGHRSWKMNCVVNKISLSGRLMDDNDVLDEAVNTILKLDQENISLNNINVFADGTVLLSNNIDRNFLQQILEIDADCCAMCMVVNQMLRDTKKEMEEYVLKHNLSEKDYARGIIFYRSLTLGLITGAAGIMCGYFDSRIPGSTFARLSVLLASDHPINAIRFYKMLMCLHGLVRYYYKDEEIVSALMSEQDTFSVDIFMHKNGDKDFMNCYWLPVQTKEAQEFIVKLDEGWNQIRDSLQRFATLPLMEKIGEHNLRVFDESIWFDHAGKLI